MAAQAGLRLAWWETPEDTFCNVVAHIQAQEAKGSNSSRLFGHKTEPTCKYFLVIYAKLIYYTKCIYR